jgi:hypothetical protein
MKRTVESRRGLIRLGLVCCVIVAVASVFSFEGARMVGAPLPLHFLLFTLGRPANQRHGGSRSTQDRAESGEAREGTQHAHGGGARTRWASRFPT